MTRSGRPLLGLLFMLSVSRGYELGAQLDARADAHARGARGRPPRGSRRS